MMIDNDDYGPNFFGRSMNGTRIAIDFDDTIALNRFPNIGPSVYGSKTVINDLYNKGYYIIISSCRNNPTISKHLNTTMKQMKQWLDSGGYFYDQIDDGRVGKAYAHIYIDDKCINFSGKWDKDFQETIQSFKTWMRKERDAKK